MRLVTVKRAASPDAPSASLPDGGLLAEAATLPTRFPEARLRPCSLVRLSEADARAHARVWVALESLQVTGSFKVRGALLALSRLAAVGAKSVVAASAGNHGAGVAYAANVLDVEATIVVPKNAPKAKRARITAYGARLVVSESPGYDEAEREAKALAQRTSAAFLSPYDDVAVVAGNGASLGHEIEEALGHPPAVLIAPFGGGGLATGLACALPSTKVVGAQSEASPAFALSIERGAAVESLETGDTLADGLEGGISQAAFARARAVVEGVLVVSERSIALAMAEAYRSLGMTIEGAAAAALAPLVEGPLPETVRPPSPHEDLVIVLSGRNVDRARLDTVLEQAPPLDVLRRRR
jgi:threonine dehydratase